jgi:hypothetical protein
LADGQFQKIYNIPENGRLFGNLTGGRIKLPGVFAALREILREQKLGKNLHGYHGETIDIRAALREVKAAAREMISFQTSAH